MVENMQDNQDADNLKSEPAIPEPINTITYKTPKSVYILSTLALAIAIGSSLNFEFFNKKKLQEQQDHLSSLVQLQQAQTQLLSNNESMNHQIQQVHKQLGELEHTFTQKLIKITEQNTVNKQDWLLLKARYYIELAQINGTNYDALSSTIDLMQQANQLLQQSNNQKVSAIRNALAEDISSLRQTQPTNLSNVLTSLSALQADVALLKIDFIESTPVQQQSPQNQNSWKAQLKENLAKIKKLIIIRNDDDALNPMLSPLFFATLKEIICLNIQQAEWALVHNNVQMYQHALLDATNNLKKTFAVQSKETSALLTKLDSLQQLTVTRPTTHLDTIHVQLNQLIEENQGAVE